jgi:hypothetical protein
MDSIGSFVALVGFVVFPSWWLVLYDLSSIWQCPRSCRLLQNLITLPCAAEIARLPALTDGRLEDYL